MLDAIRKPPAPAKAPPTDRPTSARSGRGIAPSAVMALLIAGTSWVVASWVSAWLVPPYLTLMALLLLPPAGRPQGRPRGVGADPASTDALEPTLSAEDPVDRSAPESSPASAEAPAGSGPDPESPPTKGRRGKARTRKAKPAPEPVEATWIEVAPGKFIRSEGPRSTAEAGPHDFRGGPAEVPTSPPSPTADEPNPLDQAEASESVDAPPGAESDSRAEVQIEGPGLDGWPAEDASTDPDPVGIPEDSPPEDVEGSGSSEVSGSEDGIETPDFEEEASAADGIAPRVEIDPEESPADRPEADLGELEDPTWTEWEGEGSGPVEDPASEESAPASPIESPDLVLEAVDEFEPTPPGSTDLEEEPTASAETPGPEADFDDEEPEEWDEGEGLEDPEAVGSTDTSDLEFADHPAQDEDAWEPVDVERTTEEGDDPTETAVDETVLDDAEASEGTLEDLDEAPELADDLPDAGTLPGVPAGPGWWPWRLVPRARTRDGHDPRATSNASPPRRPARPRRPVRRPLDPRRLTRRGAGRPRQITRTFPPRPPPRGALAAGECCKQRIKSYNFQGTVASGVGSLHRPINSLLFRSPSFARSLPMTRTR